MDGNSFIAILLFLFVIGYIIYEFCRNMNELLSDSSKETITREHIVVESSDNKMSEAKESVEDKENNIHLPDCPSCHKKIPENYNFCPHCGKKFTPVPISDFIHPESGTGESPYGQDKKSFSEDLSEKISPEVSNITIKVESYIGGSPKVQGILFIAISFVIFLCVIHYWSRSISSLYWTKTPCTARFLQDIGRTRTGSKANYVNYTAYYYTINDKTYDTDREHISMFIFLGAKGMPGGDFDSNKPVCYVNPNNPADAVLTRGPTFSGICYTIIFGLAVFFACRRGISDIKKYIYEQQSMVQKL